MIHFYIFMHLSLYVSECVLLWKRSVAAGRAAKGGSTVQRAAFGGAKIWNSEIWPLLVNWRLHCRQ